MKKYIVRINAFVAVSAVAVLMFFQNCSQPGMIIKDPDNKLSVCQGVSCTLDPLTDKPAVTTILLALGDKANKQLVVNGVSSQLIAETVIRYTSPKNDPKILLVQDYNIYGESPEDTVYIKDVLLKRYNVSFIVEGKNGLTSKDVEGYDLIWFNNPGHPMSSKNTMDILMAFPGAVVLQGDDLSQGSNFSLEPLTGLKHIDNGTEVICNGKKYYHNDNNGEQFRVSLNATAFPQNTDATAINFRYGNDIDKTVVTKSSVEVIAVAKGGPSACTEERPAIVRYTK